MSKAKIIISRTDSIGDVTLTLPVAGAIKAQMPDAHILFLGRTYTEPLINACEHIEEFLNWDELSRLTKKDRAKELRKTGADVILHVFPDKDIAFAAEKAKIPLRIGTARRWYNLLTCNHLLNYSRRKSRLHEAQLNLKLLQGLEIKSDYRKKEIPPLYGLNDFEEIPEAIAALLDPQKFKLILHPKSKGSAKEWNLENYFRLIDLLPASEFQVFICGTEADGALIRKNLKGTTGYTDLTGKLSLSEYISFIRQCNGLVAASTGPLHIAAATGRVAIGLFSSRRPIHPGRWAPTGENAAALVYDKNCPECKQNKDCNCINDISPEKVKESLLRGIKNSHST